MDIEELSKTQIILLVLLVTFVTSIATGIVTVSLLAQAPPAVTQTVNHIIQRTVEAVTPTVGGETTTTVKETTVVVKEDDLVTASVAGSLAKVARVHLGLSTTTPVVALGIVVPGGLLLTDSSLVSEEDHMVTFDATSTVYVSKKRYGEVGIAVLAPKSGTTPTSFHIGDATALKLGQSVVALPSASRTRIGLGAIAARFNLARVDSDGDDVVVRALETNISGTIIGGAPLINVFGDAVGIATSVSLGEGGGAGTFVALSDFMNLISGVKGTSTPVVAE